MSDYKLYQLMTYLTAYPAMWRELQGLPGPGRARSGLLDRMLAWLGRRMVALGEGLQARYGRTAELPVRTAAEPCRAHFAYAEPYLTGEPPL